MVATELLAFLTTVPAVVIVSNMNAQLMLSERHILADNGKGDHKHVGDAEIPYAFTTPAVLLDDFWADVNSWRS